MAGPDPNYSDPNYIVRMMPDMNGLSKSFTLAVTSLSMAVIAVVAFAWFGPGLDRVAPPASAALFDERLVQQIYEEASPAVVDINVDLKVSDSFNRLGAGSGFLIDMDGHIVTNNHVIQNADRVRVSFQDRTSVEAEVLGTNPANDSCQTHPTCLLYTSPSPRD